MKRKMLQVQYKKVYFITIEPSNSSNKYTLNNEPIDEPDSHLHMHSRQNNISFQAKKVEWLYFLYNRPHIIFYTTHFINQLN
jgi:hypothetical protein